MLLNNLESWGKLINYNWDVAAVKSTPPFWTPGAPSLQWMWPEEVLVSSTTKTGAEVTPLAWTPRDQHGQKESVYWRYYPRMDSQSSTWPEGVSLLKIVPQHGFPKINVARRSQFTDDTPLTWTSKEGVSFLKILP